MFVLLCFYFFFSFSGGCEICAYDEEIHSTTRTEESSSSEATAEFFFLNLSNSLDDLSF